MSQKTKLLRAPEIAARILAFKPEKRQKKAWLIDDLDILYLNFHDWEKGRFYPSESRLQKIAEKLSIPRDWLEFGYDFARWRENAENIDPETIYGICERLKWSEGEYERLVNLARGFATDAHERLKRLDPPYKRVSPAADDEYPKDPPVRVLLKQLYDLIEEISGGNKFPNPQATKLHAAVDALTDRYDKDHTELECRLEQREAEVTELKRRIAHLEEQAKKGKQTRKPTRKQTT